MRNSVRSSIVTACVVATSLLTTIPADAATPGQLDRTFGGDGKQTTFNRGGTGYAVAIDANGRIVVAGYTLTGQTDLAVARFLPDGKPDKSFGGDGRVITDLGGTDYGFDVAIHPDGGIVVVGERDTRSGSRAAVVRYLPRGKRNKDFGGDGIVLTSFGKKYQGANAVVVSADGNITIGGFTSNGSTAKWAMARYGPRGVLDKRFGGNGKVTVDLAPADEQINDMVLAKGGGLVATGSASSGMTPRFAIARFRPNGSLDKRFGHKGRNLVDVSKGSDIAFGLGQGSDGSLVAVGYAQNGKRDGWGLAAFGPKGRRDDRFGKDGVRVLQLGPQYEFAYDAHVQTNGKIVVVGRASRKSGGDEFGVFR
ncbi:MAG TPA: delta-60 repeat domain-containing protein, partial [Actinomycetota bacterium]